MSEIRVRVGGSGGASITVDSELSLTSVNPVQNKVITAALGDKADTSDLSAVATSGDYADLSGAPELATVATSGDYSDLSGAPELATVATSGDYSDLSGTPTLATVATSGSYTDLSDKPTIPAAVTVDDALSSSSENPVQNKVITAALAGISSWVTSVPEMHRNIFRGRSLGSTVTAAQLAAIEDGSFDDLYVGDYWTIPTTVDGTLKDVKYRIIDADYFMNKGNASTKVTAHHLVVMPDDIIATAPYNTTAAQAFFKTSSLYTTTLPAIDTTLTGIFGDNLLEHTITVEASGALFGRQWVTLRSDVPSMSQVIGSTTFINSIVKDTGNTLPLFALFALCPRFLTSESAGIWWLRDLYAAEGSSMQAQVMGNGGMLAYMNFTTPEGVRPYFLIGVSDANNS